MAKKGGPSIQNMHIAFGAACVILLVSTVYAFYQDYRRDFTPWQKEYYEKEMERLQRDRDAAKTDEAEPDFQKALADVQADIEKGKAEVTKNQAATDAAKAKEREIDNKLQLAQRVLNGFKSDLQVATYEVDAGKRDKADLVRLQKLADDKFAEVKGLQAERDAAQKIIDGASADLKTSSKRARRSARGGNGSRRKNQEGKGQHADQFRQRRPRHQLCRAKLPHRTGGAQGSARGPLLCHDHARGPLRELPQSH